jgi:DNA-binding CsgD family transcriptional regulator/tetratricopeptide (TPR) repeat protein
VVARDLERGRDAYAGRLWRDAFDALSLADAASPLGPEDVELLAHAAFMLARDDDAVGYLERAHRLHLAHGDELRAAHCAAWACLNLFTRGQIGPAGGWLAASKRLLEKVPDDRGLGALLLIPRVFQQEAAAAYEDALATADQVREVAERVDDPDLFALGVCAQGQMLLRLGRLGEGLARLDEAMVAVTSRAVSPMVPGIVYCGVILFCQSVFEARRAREWTHALERWCRDQPQMVAFTGRCLVHRAEVLQLQGSWRDALEEVVLAGERFEETHNPAAGLAHYRRADLLRLRGDFGAAEAAYREASTFAWEPQPGLAQLRLAQGKLDAALAAIRRARAETDEPLRLAVLLPAAVEIMLAAGALDEARAACGQLEAIAEQYDSAMLRAIVGYARGAVHLAEDDPGAALAHLRPAAATWVVLEAPYEVARTRVLVGLAFRALGDADTAVLELEAARVGFAELEAVPDVERVEALLGRRRDERHGLSARELEVLRLVAAGKSNREIAGELVISEHTVARHLQNIFGKLGLSSRTAATAFAFEHELV